ncbi:SagB/ThcOx family dehydrogenase [Candidatus Saganbacteria bacterium]|nr:SagB/ThcOx family dehydrogenase [Candidatus Saganbacteria bacterium]
MRKRIITSLILIVFCSLAYAETITLPQSRSTGQMSLEEAIYRRRSERSFLETPLNSTQISQLLWACQGITDPQWNFRSAPSAGSLYPLEIYAVDKTGVYHYLPLEHKLEVIVKGDKRQSLARAALAQTFVAEAPFIVIVSANYNKTRTKFGSRAERYVYIEAGTASENLLLQATALGLKTVCVGSFWDDVVAASMSLPPDHEPLLLIPIGYEKK